MNGRIVSKWRQKSSTQPGTAQPPGWTVQQTHQVIRSFWWWDDGKQIVLRLHRTNPQAAAWSSPVGFPHKTPRNQWQLQHRLTRVQYMLLFSEVWVQVGDTAGPVLRVCLNKVKFNCGDEAAVGNLVHVLHKHVFKMGEICRCRRNEKWLFCHFLDPQNVRKVRTREWCRNQIRSAGERDESKQKLSRGLTHFHQCVCLPLQMNGRCYKVGY